MFQHLVYKNVVKALNTWRKWAADQAIYRQKVGIVLKRFHSENAHKTPVRTVLLGSVESDRSC